MVFLYSSVIGILAFVVGVGTLGLWLRHNPSRQSAEKTSRVAHFLFFAGLVLPPTLMLCVLGVEPLDRLAGFGPLAPALAWRITGLLLLVAGLYFLVASNRLLRKLGSGANTFRLTGKIVVSDVYGMTRNPMSLGYYLFALALGLASGSTALTLGVLFGLVPAHLFFLKYLEELELELRFGNSYREYKRKTPFLVLAFSGE